MSSAPVARPYAQALLDAAGTDAVRVADELDAFAALRHEAPVEWAQLVAPGVPASARKAAIDQLLADAHQLVRNLLKVLVDNARLEQAPDVAVAFRELVKLQEDQLDVHVTSAVALGDDLRVKLEQRLSSSTGKQVRLHASVDPDIVGGLVVRHGDTLIDTSLRGRLEQLRLSLSRPTARPASNSSAS
jgi:F-type H+-transporting ATPase subunit delta